MSPNVQTVIDRILAREGGVADVGDGAGLTRWGQTGEWLKEYDLPVPQSRPDAAANYAKWMDIEHLDAVCDFDVELGDDVCDACVNDGAETGIEFLQRPLGVAVDGRIGPATLAALAKATVRTLRCAVLAEDAQYHGALITNHPAEAEYADGWANRLAGKILRLA